MGNTLPGVELLDHRLDLLACRVTQPAEALAGDAQHADMVAAEARADRVSRLVVLDVMAVAMGRGELLAQVQVKRPDRIALSKADGVLELFHDDLSHRRIDELRQQQRADDRPRGVLTQLLLVVDDRQDLRLDVP